jgi:hypothetical protein
MGDTLYLWVIGLTEALLHFRSKPGILLSNNEVSHELAYKLGRRAMGCVSLGHELIAQVRFQLQREYRLLQHDCLL